MTRVRLELAHLVVLVRELDPMVDFYTRVLGFDVTDRGPSRRAGCEIVFLSASPDAHHQLAFVNAREDASAGPLEHQAYRAAGTLDDLRRLVATLRTDGRASEITPVSHGNTWSVYFRDPERNRVEIYLDTPWHVAQPQREVLDLDLTDAEIAVWTERTFGSDVTFEPHDEYVRRRTARQ